MELLTIPALRQSDHPVTCRVRAQLDKTLEKTTRDGKPYLELTLADAEAKLTLRAWNDSPMFGFSASLPRRAFLEVEGEFSLHPSFGLEAKQWQARLLESDEIETLLGGNPALREKQEADFTDITDLLASIRDPRLHHVCQLAITDLGERYRRAAAARSYHHARRGGLVEHVAQMMRAGAKLCEVYPRINRDLFLAGAFLHDIGKLWESCPPADGFTIPYDVKGELIGHITIGIEILNHFWRKMMSEDAATAWNGITPSNETVRVHLIHLIASHHGELAFGSPVPPKTPEAHLLHFVDNLDAKLEMVYAAYEKGTALTDEITERVFPLPGHLVRPLPVFDDFTPPAQ